MNTQQSQHSNTSQPPQSTPPLPLLRWTVTPKDEPPISMKSWLVMDLYFTPAKEGYTVYLSSAMGATMGHLPKITFNRQTGQSSLKHVSREHEFLAQMTLNDGATAVEPKAIGSFLFSALFHGSLYARYISNRDYALLTHQKLHIRLHFEETPELAVLPWEYLYDADRHAFLALSTRTPVMRFFQLAQPNPPQNFSCPIKILGVVSSPKGVTPLDTMAERNSIETAITEINVQHGRQVFEVRWLEDATPRALQNALREEAFHIFHFAGHSTFDHEANEGALIMEDAEQRPVSLSAEALALLLQDHVTLRLAVLNSCEGATIEPNAPYAGLAQKLIQAGLPAAIAMQEEISDEAALCFAQEFYGAIADGQPIHYAVGEARKAIFIHGNRREWAIPVLFSTIEDGQILQIPCMEHD